jgi:hypothetical protein
MAGNAAPGVGVAGISVADDMRAYDQLPPRCRAAIGAAIIPWSPFLVLRRFARTGRSTANPADDTFLADELDRIDREQAEESRTIGEPYSGPVVKVKRAYPTALAA